MSERTTSSPKFQAARDSLPEERRPVYDRLVEDYGFRTTVRFGRGYVAYQVLADLVSLGWRPSADANPVAEA